MGEIASNIKTGRRREDEEEIRNLLFAFIFILLIDIKITAYVL